MPRIGSTVRPIVTVFFGRRKGTISVLHLEGSSAAGVIRLARGCAGSFDLDLRVP